MRWAHTGQLRVARIRRFPGQGLVEQTAERVDVRPHPVHLVTLNLFGGDVGGCAERQRRLEPGRLLGQPPGEAEVGQVHVLVGVEQDVGRLDVSVDEPALVCGIECSRHLARDPDRPLGLEWPLVTQEPLQVAPFHVAHCQVQLAIDFARVVNGHDA